MSSEKITDPFMQFIWDNQCREECDFHDPFYHTHKLFGLHENIAPENCECGKKI
jgi:hypothetical protein